MTDHVSAELPPAEEIVRRYERDTIAQHAYFLQLGREPVDMRRLWLLIANGREGVVQDFSRRLANVTARIGDERLRCMLAKQLNDELGDGDYTKAHRLLYEQLLSGLDPWRPEPVVPAMLRPGQELGQRLEAIYFDPEAYVGIGASMVIEVLGKQIDVRVGQELRRQHRLTPEAMTWLTIHEELEIDHADESMTMAHMVPPSGPALAATWRGAEAVGAAFWVFFDAMYGDRTQMAPAPIFSARASP